MLVISVRSHPGALGHLLGDEIDGTLGQAIAGLSPRLEHKYRRRPIAAVDGGWDATRNRSPMRWFSAANPHCIVALQSARLRRTLRRNSDSSEIDPLEDAGCRALKGAAAHFSAELIARWRLLYGRR